MRKILLAAAVTAAIVVPTAVGNTTDAVDYYSHADVTVSCEPLLAQDGPQAWAELATLTIHMDRSICRQLSRPKAVEFPFAVFLLLHEAAHIRYQDTVATIPVETRADCVAHRTLKDALRRFYGFTKRQAWDADRQVRRNPDLCSSR